MTAKQARAITDYNKFVPIEKIHHKITVVAKTGGNQILITNLSPEAKQQLQSEGYKVEMFNIGEYKISW